MNWRDRMAMGFFLIGAGLELGGWRFGHDLIIAAGTMFIYISFQTNKEDARN